MQSSDRSALQKAMDGQPEEVRARVMEIALHSGVEPDEPYFQMLEAMGFLKVLIEDAPGEWGQLFNIFGENLDQWQSENKQTLKSLKSQAPILKKIDAQQLASDERLTLIENQISAIRDRIQEEARQAEAWRRQVEDSLEQVSVDLQKLSPPPSPSRLMIASALGLLTLIGLLSFSNWHGRHTATQSAHESFGGPFLYQFGQQLMISPENLDRLSACVEDSQPDCSVRIQQAD